MNTFKIGDRVRIKKIDEHTGNLQIGYEGNVVEIDKVGKPPIGIDWERTLLGGHDCQEHCPNGQGWFVFPENIELVNLSEVKSEEIKDTGLRRIKMRK
jgi:hypothetical protein